MSRKQTARKQFRESSIKAQEFRKGSTGRGRIHKISNDKFYGVEAARLRSRLSRLSAKGVSRKQLSTISAFIRNFYVTHNKLPTIRELKQVFPFLKEFRFRE